MLTKIKFLLLVIVEAITLSMFKTNLHPVISVGLYSLIGFGLSKLIHSEGLVAGHAFYDFSSILVISLIGIFYFKEKVSIKQVIGLLLGIVSVVLLDTPHSHYH